MTPRRHDLLDVAVDAWANVVADLSLPDEAARLVAGWSRRGWPVIVRRRLAGDAADKIPVALQLPNAAGRLRVALTVPADSVTERSRLDLAEAAASAPPDWCTTIAALIALGKRFGRPAVYGGLLWQHVIGEPVLRPGSDLDLLWSPSPRDRPALVAALAKLEAGAVRVDGEIVLEDGGAVAWRELYAAAMGRTKNVAVKTFEAVALVAVDAILHDETMPC